MKDVLQNTMQSYFHQDWRTEFSSVDEVVRCIVAENSSDFISHLVEELERFLESNQSDSEAEIALEELSCDYIPPNARTWILDFVSRLRIESKVNGGS